MAQRAILVFGEARAAGEARPLHLRLDAVGRDAARVLESLAGVLIDRDLGYHLASWDSGYLECETNAPFARILVVSDDAAQAGLGAAAATWGAAPTEPHIRVVVPVGESWRHKASSAARLHAFAECTGALPVLPLATKRQYPPATATAVVAALVLPLLRGVICADWVDAAMLLRYRGPSFAIAAHSPEARGDVVRGEIRLLGDALLEIDAFGDRDSLHSAWLVRVAGEDYRMGQYEDTQLAADLLGLSDVDRCVISPCLLTAGESELVPARGLTTIAVFRV